MAKVTVTLDVAEGTDPFSVNTTRSKRTKIRLFIKMLRALIGAGIVSRLSTRPTLKVGTAQASCTATLVTPVTGNKVTINGKDCTAAQLHARAVATFTGAPTAAQTFTVGVTAFVATAGAVVLGAATFSIDTSDTARAASLAAQINAHPVAGLLVQATAALGVVSLRAVTAGTGGNAIALAETCSNVALTAAGGGALAGAFLEGGAAASGDQWDYGDTDTQAATSLKNCINASTTALIANVVEATSALGVVTIKAAKKGLGGNTNAVAKTGAPITLASVTNGLMTGGTETTLTL